MATPIQAMSHRATVYTEAASGTFSTVAKADLACRALHISNQRASDLPGRAEAAAARRLLWDPDYVMPSYAQVELDVYAGVRWNVMSESIEVIEWLDGSVAYRRALIVRAK